MTPRGLRSPSRAPARAIAETSAGAYRPRVTRRGSLIAVEGADGAGTTTQCQRLAEWLRAHGRAVHQTREPSTGPVGRLVRAVLTGTNDELRGFDPGALALLFAADRLDHLAREIEPALAAGAVVLSDRYLLSSLAYQSLTVPREFVAATNKRAPAADLTLLVDVPPEVAAERRARRGGPAELFEHDEVQRRVIAAYRDEAERLRAAGERVVVVDGRPDADTVQTALRAALVAELGLPGDEPRTAGRRSE